MMNTRIMLTILAAVLGIISFAGDKLVIAGSTTNQMGYVVPSKMDAEQALGIELVISGGGSSKGVKLCLEGKVDIGMASRPLKESEKKAGAVAYVAAWDAIGVIVNKSNPVKSLTIQQLKDIHTGKVLNWKDLGGPDSRIVVVTSHKGSATRDMFQKIVMSKEPYVEGVIQVRTTRLEVGKVSRFKGAIGAVSTSFIDPTKVRVIEVNGKEPTKENILNKAYPIARPLLLCTKGKATGNAKKYIDWILGPMGQAWIGKKFITATVTK